MKINICIVFFIVGIEDVGVWFEKEFVRLNGVEKNWRIKWLILWVCDFVRVWYS